MARRKKMLLWTEECQPLTNEQMDNIKSQFHPQANGSNINITPYHIYSTTEHIVGEWIDGKALYEKTINFGALPNATTKSVAHGISNLYRVIHLSAIAYSPALSQTLTVPHVGTGALVDGMAVFQKDNNVTVQCGRDRTSYTECYITIQYTKS